MMAKMMMMMMVMMMKLMMMMMMMMMMTKMTTTKHCITVLKLKMHFSHRSDPRNLQLWEALQEYRRSEANGNLNEAGLTSKLLL